MTKLLMRPTAQIMGGEESGIKRVVEAYEKYLPQFGYEFTENVDEVDLIISHASSVISPDVLVCHGLYWTADYKAKAPKSEWGINRDVINCARVAKQVTVPSRWVQEVFQRDMRMSPTIVPHGIEWEEWENIPKRPSTPYVLWNKNRVGVDVCSTDDLVTLAYLSPEMRFLSTFANHIPNKRDNLTEIGLQAHPDMVNYVKGAAVYLATVKETFGIGILEAMAAGVPVLGWHGGGIEDLVQHGVNGFLAQRGDFDGLKAGLDYCLKHRDTLGANGREIAKAYTWVKGIEKLHHVLLAALTPINPTVSVVIPCYNYGEKVGRAIESAKNQTFPPEEIIVVDDGSNEDSASQTKEVCEKLGALYIRKENGGVATARNAGISAAYSAYICCLDADDAIAPTYLETCMSALRSDPSLALAYTGLTAVGKNGDQQLSSWPGAYNYDRFLMKQNQVPTCCVYKKEMWERLGGYNQRYAPTGAGAEDAEFFLRAGAYGFKAKKVSDEGLFLYSIGVGHTSQSGYREVDWLSLHPWVKDKQHPFASLATPENMFSHPVRQYDEPLISVIIPVGSGHEEKLRDALDSLESQTFRKWEAIVVFDNWDGDTQKIGQLEAYLTDIEVSYPYIRKFINKDPHKGAGWARNVGAGMARAGLLLFLDADDWLYPNAIEYLYRSWSTVGGIVYSDYVGKAFIGPELAAQSNSENRLLSYNDKTGEAVLKHNSADFNCVRAQQQPNPQDMYIWNLITSLVPLMYHKQIGGFDETMESWEDWDYWIRMAKIGICFSRIPEPLVVYRFYTGNRRETGLQQYPHLIQYLQEKYRRSDNVACKSCGGNRSNVNPGQVIEPVQQQVNSMTDSNYVLFSYYLLNMGLHRVVGPLTKTNYGYRGGGGVEQFFVHADDIAAAPDIFVPVKRVQDMVIPTAQPEPPKPITPEPAPITAPELHSTISVDLQLVPGISDSVQRELNAAGVYNVADLRKMTQDQLLEVKGIGKLRAEAIIKFLGDNKDL